MMRRSLVVSAVALIAGASVCAAGVAGARVARPTYHTPAQVFSTTADGGTQFTVTKQGNVSSFLSPDSEGDQYDHLASAGTAGAEGYVVCYETPRQDLYAWDTDTTFWGFQKPAPFTIVSPTEGTVTRTDIYNRETFTQDFVFDPTAGTLTITMTLKNISAAPLDDVTIRRQADFNVDAGGAQGWNTQHVNHFSETADSVTAADEASEAPPGLAAHAVVLRDISHDPSVDLTTQIDGTGTAHGCYPRVAPHPNRPGDHGASLDYTLDSLAPGASQTIVVQYQRTA